LNNYQFIVYGLVSLDPCPIKRKNSKSSLFILFGIRVTFWSSFWPHPLLDLVWSSFWPHSFYQSFFELHLWLFLAFGNFKFIISSRQKGYSVANCRYIHSSKLRTTTKDFLNHDFLNLLKGLNQIYQELPPGTLCRPQK